MEQKAKTPVYLFLATAPTPGRTYNLVPVIGDTKPCTAVCQRLLRRKTWRGNELRDENGRVIAAAEECTDEYWQFVDQATGEVFTRLVETVNEGTAARPD
jgi:hypothetical protein